MSPLPTTRIVSTVAALLDGLAPEEKDELTGRLAARGYKPELATTKRAASTGETGSILTAANAYKLFNGLGPEVGGIGLLKTLRRPCCAVPDRSWQDPNTGKLVDRVISFGHWRPDYTVTVAYRFSRTPDAGDHVTAALIARCMQVALDCWMSVSGIRLELTDDFERANIRIVDAAIDRQHGVLADMYLPGPGAVAEGHVCKGRFDWWEAWAVHEGGRGIPAMAIDFLDVLIHELGHAWGMDHEPGDGQERLNPMYTHFPHMLSDGRHWVGPKDTATMRRVYGTPVAKPTPPPPPPPPGPEEPPPPPGPRSGSLLLKGRFVPAGRSPRLAVSLDGVFSGDYDLLP